MAAGAKMGYRSRGVSTNESPIVWVLLIIFTVVLLGWIGQCIAHEYRNPPLTESQEELKAHGRLYSVGTGQRLGHVVMIVVFTLCALGLVFLDSEGCLMRIIMLFGAVVLAGLVGTCVGKCTNFVLPP